MTDWHRAELAAFDIESTGLDVDTDRIVTAALWRIGATTGEKTCAHWLADPGIEIPEAATAVHGITTEHARTQGRSANGVVGEIAEELADLVDQGIPVVVFNAAYDLTLFDRELARHGHAVDFAGRLRVIDPMVLDRHVDPYRRGSRRLADVCAHYRVPLEDREAHGCRADALAAARLAWRLGSLRSELAAMDLDDLHAAQRRWRAEQAASLEGYLRRAKNPQAVVERDWPLIPAT